MKQKIFLNSLSFLCMFFAIICFSINWDIGAITLIAVACFVAVFCKDTEEMPERMKQ